MKLFGSRDKVAGAPPADQSLIEVRDLIARYSNAEHIARADAYFSAIPEDSLLMRKPFFGLHDTPANLYGVSEVLNGLRLFPGARVLDFGAGTGWLSKVLSLIDCRPVACDVSSAALAMGRRAFERDPLAQGLSIEWQVFDGVRIACEDGSIDRIVCYDSFHHVADQNAVLREFSRVLRLGGIAGFHEPGPDHSRAPVSQYEMRHHDVIENDIHIEEIWRMAEAAGFTGMEVALAAPVSAKVGIDTYNRLARGTPTGEDLALVSESIVRGADNLRIFFINKGDEPDDSRHGKGLGGALSLQITEVKPDVLMGRATVTNTGSVRWRASVPEVGGVWIGVRDANARGGPDYGRIKISDGGVAPGEVVELSFTLPAPRNGPIDLLFDFVAENVAWFELFGSKPVLLPIG